MKYHISGSLDAEKTPFEDFFSEKGGPNVTIAKFDGDPEMPFLADGEAFSFDDLEDGWFDASVIELSLETARQVLAAINGVSVDEIEIVQDGSCASF